MSLPAIDQAEYRIGYGVIVSIGGRVVPKNSRFMGMEGCAMNEEIREAQAYCRSQGYSLVLVALDARVIGAIELHATIRVLKVQP